MAIALCSACTGKTVLLFSCGLEARVVITSTNSRLSRGYRNMEKMVTSFPLWPWKSFSPNSRWNCEREWYLYKCIFQMHGFTLNRTFWTWEGGGRALKKCLISFWFQHLLQLGFGSWLYLRWYLECIWNLSGSSKRNRIVMGGWLRE